MATYAEMAPIISGTGTTKTNVDNYFSNVPVVDTSAPLPTITKAKVIIVANAYLVEGIESNNGYRGIARKAGLKAEQVKAIIKEIQVLKAAWDVLNPVEEPVIEE